MKFSALLLLWVVLFAVSLGIGQYPVSLEETGRILLGSAAAETAKSVVLDIRIPRALLSSLCGGILALSGLALQAVFKNPLVGPHIVGVSTAAAFGGALCILLGFGSFYIVGFAFFFGLAALFMLYFIAKLVARADIFSLILAGIVINGVFAALTSLVQYLADNEEVLPNIVYWLLGSFVSANYDKITLMAIVALPCATILIMLRWRFNLLSLNDDDLKALGLNIVRLRSVILLLCTLLIAVQVSVSGNIGWVGLVVPHIVRLIAGSDHVRLMPACFIAGAVFMLAIDDLSRCISSAEVPLGILSALVGSPIFAFLLKRSSKNAKSN
ncbi:FecCD family ABC transporter permease [Campylobacter rectus]|uniref:FecCD family ABC transporter permease n=1 Tax=Campylobacter rectus TaxID=203 RepID=UPI000F5F9701|nr:iron ABC transporter permease [Campylobacter rectus]RRD54189.1 iron ABC transporter permease [Campylobacter rectus]